MLLYRGQKYGLPCGQWWTTNKHDAEQIARSRSSQEWVVIAVEVDAVWADQFFEFEADSQQGDWYRIPLDRLKEQALAVRICDGFLSLP